MEGREIDGVALLPIEVDGMDATDKLLAIMNDGLADAVILGGITFAGFNVIDPRRVFQETGVPVIVYTGKRPDDGSMLVALKTHFSDWKRRWDVIESLGKVHEVVTRLGEPPAYFEVVGGSAIWAEGVLRSSALVCRIPEPVRVAGLVARGVSPVTY
jgi:endonuclease V-like protein UPF0215 family